MVPGRHGRGDGGEDVSERLKGVKVERTRATECREKGNNKIRFLNFGLGSWEEHDIW